MIKKILSMAAGTAALAALVFAQTPKSPEETKAIQAVMQAQQPDARIKAVEELVAKFADTEFKSWAYGAAAEAAAAKRDNAKATFYYEQSLKADAKNYNAMLMLAGLMAQSTREFDLDKEEKLSKAEKYVKTAMDIIPTAPKPNPQVTDEQWEAAKKEDLAQAHVDLGMIASVRKKFDVAVTEYKSAVEASGGKDIIAMIRLAGAYNDSGSPDNAIFVLDKVLATPNLDAGIKQVADAEKARSQKMKTAK